MNYRLLFLVCLSAFSAPADMISQTIVLQPGWNAVFLEVAPTEADVASVFGSPPLNNRITRAAMWTGEPASAQFITDPAKLFDGTPGWLQYRATLPEQNTLNRLLPGRAYVIEVSNGSSINWTITGNTPPRAIRWLPDTFTLTGFPVSDAAPTFEAYFAGSPAHRDQRVLQMVANSWAPIEDLSATTIERGRAYWVFTRGTSDFQGPLRVRLEGGGLDFGDTASNLTLAVLADIAGEPVPPDLEVNFTLLTEIGQTAVPLSYRESDYQSGTFSWVSLSNTRTLAFPALSERVLSFQADRAALPQGAPPGTRYTSLLRIEGAGMRHDLPVFITQGADPRVGLWVGYAVLNKVSEHIGKTPRTDATPVGRDFSYRLLIHVDETGEARLLQKALLVYPEPAMPIVLASDAAISAYTAQLNPTEEQTGMRMSSPAFNFDEPILGVEGSRTFPAGGTSGSLDFEFTLAHNDPLNPFVHLYHPDHDNLNAHENPIDPGTAASESWSITRSIALEFSSDDPEGRNPAGWGIDEVGGFYGETVAGLMRAERKVQTAAGEPSQSQSNAILARGYFRLTRVSTTPTLDP